MTVLEIQEASPATATTDCTATVRATGIEPVHALAEALARASWDPAKQIGIELAELVDVRLDDEILDSAAQITNWRERVGMLDRRLTQFVDVALSVAASLEKGWIEGAGLDRHEAARRLRDIVNATGRPTPMIGALALSLRAAASDAGPGSLADLLNQTAGAVVAADGMRAWIMTKMASPHQPDHDGHRDGFCRRCADLYEQAHHAVNAYDVAADVQQ